MEGYYREAQHTNRRLTLWKDTIEKHSMQTNTIMNETQMIPH